ncbi:MAG: CotH kinase family protein [Verrucomicrobiota bacterium]
MNYRVSRGFIHLFFESRSPFSAMTHKVFLIVFLLFCACNRQEANPVDLIDENSSALFERRVIPQLSIEIPEEGMEVLRAYRQFIKQPRPERIDVKATVREGTKVYTDVGIHLKGSYSFQPIDARPSLTLNFDKFHKGQRFHGLTKLHLNNTVQDPTYLCEALARELFNDIGVPTPRGAHALLTLNGRTMGLYVLIEGANKPFLKRHFTSTEGNLYAGNTGQEINSGLEVDSGKNREDQSALLKLAEAAEEPDSAKRWTQLEQLLDIDQFISFIACEVLLVHWDGYSLGAPNNYRVFHDVGRGKLVFMPQGLDQLFRGGTTAQKLTPHFIGIVARGLVSTPEGRRRYLARLASLSAKEFSQEALFTRVDRIAAAVRTAVTEESSVTNFNQGVDYLKAAIIARTEGVARLLKIPPAPPLVFDSSNQTILSGWQFKSSNSRPASGSKVVLENRALLQVQSRGPDSSGSWRTQVLLEEGRYELTGRARTQGFNEDEATGANGVILRISGEKLLVGSASSEWTNLSYEFEVNGIQDVELVCEFRGGQGIGQFDPESMRLTRKP